MKKSILALLFISLFSCSEDEETPDDNNLSATTYISLNTNNFWKYRIETKNGTQATVVSPTLDHLKVGLDEVVSGVTFKKMEAVGVPAGFYTGTMDQKKLRKISDRIEFTGNISLELGNGLPTQTIPVENFIIFKESAANNTALSTKEGTLAPIPISLPINGTNQNIVVTIKYKFRSVAGETLTTFTPPVPNSGIPATTYNNVKSTRFILTIEASAPVTISPLPTITLQLLSPASQDFIVSTSYFAKNIGVVHTQTNTNLTFSSTLNFPPISILQREYLDGFLNN
jgi:hypothetical protein